MGSSQRHLTLCKQAAVDLKSSHKDQTLSKEAYSIYWHVHEVVLVEERLQFTHFSYGLEHFSAVQGRSHAPYAQVTNSSLLQIPLLHVPNLLQKAACG
jgi:hypothetical protein